MWIYIYQLFAVWFCLGVGWSHAVEKDLEVKCLDSQATSIKEGGVVADCAFQGLTRTSTIGTWLFELANVLQGVNASHNHIKRVSRFPVLPRVLTLSLNHNSIREMEPLAFTGLDNLQNLDLSYNRISGESLQGVLVGKKAPERYESLPIRILFLSFNDISGLDPSVFVHLQYLRDLHLDHNPLVVNESFSEALHQLPELKLLNLAGTGLTSLPQDVFSGLSLSSLLLSGNQFTQVPDLSVLGGSLRLLNINQNPIAEFDDSSFSGLRSLTELVASGMPKLTAIRAGTFSGLESIRVVSCSYNPELVTVDESAFWNHDMTKRFPLKEVYLNNNALPRIRRNILPWLKMSKVTLDGNKWVCDCRLHWLAKLLRIRNTTVDRLTELKCWEPIWLNGTQIVFWEIDMLNRHENFPCQAELEEERKEQERIRLEYEEKVERERLERIRLEERMKDAAEPPESDVEEEGTKLYHLLAVAAIVAVVVLIVSIIAVSKYRNYRPIYNVEKMSSPMHNEMKYMRGSAAEKTQLVS